MPPVLIPIVILGMAYAAACTFYGARPGAPLWLRWPHRFWARMLDGPHQPRRPRR